MKNDLKILIVGAGPTGLTAAVELARLGIVAQVIERRKEASNLSRAVGILPSSLAILEPSGVSSRLRSEGLMIGAGNFHRDNKLFARLVLKDETNPKAGILALAQDRTESNLAAVFEEMGGTIIYGAAFESLEQSDKAVRVTYLLDGKQQKQTFDYVIGADGVSSATREAIGLPFEGIELPESWSIADVDCEDWKFSGEAALFLKEKGEVQIIVPLEKTRYRVISNTPDTLSRLLVPMNIKRIRREGEFKVSVKQVPQYNVGRVFLAGDAAHCHSPVGGRGMNLGISDAAELAKRMVTDELSGYSNSRHAAGKKTINASEQGRKMVTSTSVIKRATLISFLWIVSRLPFLKRKIINVVSDS